MGQAPSLVRAMPGYCWGVLERCLHCLHCLTCVLRDIVDRDVSDNPIAAFSAATKLGPLKLVALNVSVQNMTGSAFPDMTQTM